MLNFLYSLLFIVVAVLILGICVIFHEFGHYIIARITGIDVVEFSVGMGPRILGFTRGGIDYSWRAVPIGGYCKFVGEDENSDDERAFNNQKLWKRFLTVLAGPVFNMILALVLASVLLCSGTLSQAVPKIGYVYENSPAYEAGLEAGDIITSMNGDPVEYSSQSVQRGFSAYLKENEPVLIGIRRGEEDIELSLVPRMMSTEEGEAETLMIGISFDYDVLKTSFFESIPEALKIIGQTIVLTVDYLKTLVLNLFRGILPKSGEISGPVGIVSSVSNEVKTGFSAGFGTGFMSIFYWIMFISLNLGIMNLLPLPALDGGRIVFIGYEAVRRKKVDQDKIGLVNVIGFFFLIALILLITGSDILNLIRG